MIDTVAAFCTLLILTAADRKISEKELEAIGNWLQAMKALSGATHARAIPPEELRRLATNYASLTPQGLAQALKDHAIKFKSISTPHERANLLEWARINIYADGNISGEERALFEFLSAIFDLGADVDAMATVQQQYNNASNYLQWNHNQIMGNLSMWRTSW